MLHPLQGKLTVDDEHEDRIVVNLHRVVHDQQVSFLDAVARHTFASRPQVERGGPPVPDKVFRVVDALLDKRVGVAGSPPMPFGLGYSLTTWVTMPSLWTVSPSPNHTERTSGSSATSSSSPPWRTSRRRVNSSSMKYSPMASGFHFTASSITTRSPKMMPSPNIPRFVANTARLCRLFRIINLLIDVIVSLGRIACGDLPPPLIFPGGKPCRRTHPPRRRSSFFICTHYQYSPVAYANGQPKKPTGVRAGIKPAAGSASITFCWYGGAGIPQECSVTICCSLSSFVSKVM